MLRSSIFLILINLTVNLYCQEALYPRQYSQPSEVIIIQSNGDRFAPVIEVVGYPSIEWFFNDSTTSSSATPIKDYITPGSRNNYLKVTPWSSLIGINVGYDASDGGYGSFETVTAQNVLGFKNLILAKNSLQYLCASYCQLEDLDLRGLEALKFVELFNCHNLSNLKLGYHPVLERICVEDCKLNSLDLSGCSSLKDLRGALNDYISINWGSIGDSIRHICIRDNQQINVNLPPLTQFPVLRELLNWNTSQTGQFVCHNSMIQEIISHNNHYTSADINGCTRLRKLYLSGSRLASLDLGIGNHLTFLALKDCGLSKPQVDYILHTIDELGLSDGYLDLTLNPKPSADGLAHLKNLENKGWQILPDNSVYLIYFTGLLIIILLSFVFCFCYKSSLSGKLRNPFKLLTRFWILFSLILFLGVLLASLFWILNYYFEIFPDWVSTHYAHVKTSYFLVVLLISFTISYSRFRQFSRNTKSIKRV